MEEVKVAERYTNQKDTSNAMLSTKATNIQDMEALARIGSVKIDAKMAVEQL